MVTREALVSAARSGAPPCVWFYVVLLLGRRLPDGSAIPACVAEAAVAEAVRWYVARNGRGGMISLKSAAVRKMIMLYAKEHKCKTPQDAEQTLKKHMRILMAYVRSWVRAAPSAVTRHLAVDRSWLIDFLSAHRPCG